MLIIGLVGKKGSGKDTVADFLVCNKNFTKKAFADPLKKVVGSMFLLEANQLHDQSLKEVIDARWGMSPRTMMQLVGTNIVRSHFGEDFWLKHMDMSFKDSDLLVISDVRFHNEAEWVKKKGGILIRISSGEKENVQDNHRSEIELENIQTDFVLHNDKSKGIAAFYSYLEEWFSALF